MQCNAVYFLFVILARIKLHVINKFNWFCRSFYTGTLYGLGNGLGSATGIISPILAGGILDKDVSVEGFFLIIQRLK